VSEPDYNATISQMRRVFDECLDLASRKNRDYGDAWRDQGWRGNLSRVFEKAKRLRTLLWRGDAQPSQVRESARETAIDTINTMAFFILNHDAGVEWGDETPYPSQAYIGAQPSPDTTHCSLSWAGSCWRPTRRPCRSRTGTTARCPRRPLCERSSKPRKLG
jgi:hypothetical protein